MTHDLDDLERKARAATPGPWSTTKPPHDADGWQSGVAIAATPYRQVIYATPPGGQSPLADQRHIAANSPDVTLALIARVRTAEAEAAKWRGRAEQLVRQVGGDTAGRLVRLLDERGHGAVDRELQELLDQLRPVVCG